MTKLYTIAEAAPLLGLTDPGFRMRLKRAPENDRGERLILPGVVAVKISEGSWRVRIS